MTGTGGNNVLALSIAIQTCLFGLICVIFSLSSMSFGSLKASLVYLPVALLFYWPLGAGYLTSLWTVALVGLFQDLASGGNLGIWALTYVILFILVDPTVRKPIRGFFMQWGAFTAMLLGSVFISTLLGALSIGQMPSLRNMLQNIVLLLLVFPIIFWIGAFVRQLRRET